MDDTYNPPFTGIDRGTQTYWTGTIGYIVGHVIDVGRPDPVPQWNENPMSFPVDASMQSKGQGRKDVTTHRLIEFMRGKQPMTARDISKATGIVYKTVTYRLDRDDRFVRTRESGSAGRGRGARPALWVLRD